MIPLFCRHYEHVLLTRKPNKSLRMLSIITMLPKLKLNLFHNRIIVISILGYFVLLVGICPKICLSYTFYHLNVNRNIDCFFIPYPRIYSLFGYLLVYMNINFGFEKSSKSKKVYWKPIKLWMIFNYLVKKRISRESFTLETHLFALTISVFL